MKVIILAGQPFPNGWAGTNRIKCYARAIRKGGLSVEVLIWHRTEKYGLTPKNIEGAGSFNNIPFRYIGGTPLRDKNVFVRRINDLLDSYNTDVYLKRNLSAGDVLFLYMDDYKRMKRYVKIAHSRGAYCIRDLCELPYGMGTETKRSIQFRKKVLEKVFPRLDGIVSISDALMNLAKEHTKPTCKHIKVPIMVEYEQYRIDKSNTNCEIPYIFHAGTLFQQKDGVLGMIEAFGMAVQQLKTPMKYVLTGTINESSHPNELRSIIRKYNIEDRVEFVGFLYRNQVKEYLRNASLVISNRPKSQQDYYGFSTKVGEYLASGTPLLMTNWGEAVNWLKDGVSAYIIEPEETGKLADAIVHIFTHPEESKKIGLAGQALCKDCFDYSKWSNPLCSFIKSLNDKMVD